VNAAGFDRAAAVVRAWTWAYTALVSSELRDRRRLEVDADLWEAAHDEHGDRSAVLLLLRASGGIVDDVRWTLEQPQQAAVLATAFVAMGVIAVATWLIVSYSLRVTEMPLPGSGRVARQGTFQSGGRAAALLA